MEWQEKVFSPLDVMLLHSEFGQTADPLLSASLKRDHYKREEERFMYRDPQVGDPQGEEGPKRPGGGEGGRSLCICLYKCLEKSNQI